jgi:hypothetical protein
MDELPQRAPVGDRDEVVPEVVSEGEDRNDAGQRGAPPRSELHLVLAAAMLLLTIVAILVSILIENPGPGILLAVLATPVLVRTWLIAARRQTERQPLSSVAKINLVAATVGVVVLIIVAAGSAFFVTCMASARVGEATGVGEAGAGGLLIGFLVGVVLGGIAATMVALLLILAFRRGLQRKRFSGSRKD